MTDFQKSLQLYRTVASLSLVACAALYCLGGIFCFGAIRKVRQRREDEILHASTEIEDLERRRRELERLLGRNVEP